MPRSIDADIEIEFHFESENELSEEERIDPEVRVVKETGIAELLIERDLNDRSEVVIGAGGLSLKLKFDDFIDQIAGMLKND
jgi:hypothetical protein